MLFHTSRLRLKPVSAEDLNDIHALHSIPAIDQYNTLGIPESMEQTKTLLNGWIASIQAVPQVKYVFRIENLDGGFTGITGMNLGESKYQKGEIWYKLHPDEWNKGYATEAVQALLQFGFETLLLHRIEAGCATNNSSSVKVLEKSGFIREGIGRKILPIRGAWVDNYKYAILEEEWQAKNAHKQ